MATRKAAVRTASKSAPKKKGKRAAKAGASATAPAAPEDPRPKTRKRRNQDESAPARPFERSAKPDAFDARDMLFRANISVTPKAEMIPVIGLTVKHQGETSACTGFALSTVVEYLLRKSERDARPAISPFMLYSMARRYDEFPGSTTDSGSSLRGALKGWFKHGACVQALFPTMEMPPAAKRTEDDWWLDAVKRPLGAYYRIDTRSIVEMHAALNEVGILYASAGCHDGWDAGHGMTAHEAAATPITEPFWVIPTTGQDTAIMGHAFVIVGYTQDGFLIQNSWGDEWGTHGMAVLTYDDWLRNAMDCWVVQLGVVTQEHERISNSISLRTEGRSVTLAAGKVLRDRELTPFIVNVGNNGELSNSGAFRTTPDDLRAIVDVHMAAARERWGLKDKPMDVCVYAHGGLVGEAAAAEAAAEWIPLLYESQIFPVFLMWETDFITTVKNIIQDASNDVPRTTGGIGDRLERWWNQRLERWLARPGTVIWGEMKQNAEAMSAPAKNGEDKAAMIMLYRHFRSHVARGRVRLHIVGHSAGAIVASHFVQRLAADGGELESLSLMAPAVTMKTFQQLVVPVLKTRVKRYQQFHLSDRAEEDDPTCGPYRRSLLYLVSESFEGGTTTPLLGMERYFRDAGIPCDAVHVSPEGSQSASRTPPVASSTHGGFDNDKGTQQQVIAFIKR
ncbi:C1 family peptidase [Achromobacter sp.]|uniref:C1 family peptidase n=1 Tax=Achromobacter sp. TaxID=134375 RepID=UPI0028B1D057|nr:C1 family peptidase [Achromobacter sp.]